MMTLTEFREARDLLSGILSNTNLIHSPYYSKRTGGEVYIKPENMQVTGAYKVRGACYKVSTLTDEEKAALREAVQPVYDKYASTIGQDLIDAVAAAEPKN